MSAIDTSMQSVRDSSVKTNQYAAVHIKSVLIVLKFILFFEKILYVTIQYPNNIILVQEHLLVWQKFYIDLIYKLKNKNNFQKNFKKKSRF